MPQLVLCRVEVPRPLWSPRLLHGALRGAASARGRGDGGAHPSPAPRSSHGPLGTRGHKKGCRAVGSIRRDAEAGILRGGRGAAGGSERRAGLGSEERLATRGNPWAGEKPARSRFVALPQPPRLGRERLLSPRSAPGAPDTRGCLLHPASCQKPTRGHRAAAQPGGSSCPTPPADASTTPKIPRPYCTCPRPGLWWLGSLPVTCCHQGIIPRGRGHAGHAADAQEAEASLAQHGRASSPGLVARREEIHIFWVGGSVRQSRDSWDTRIIVGRESQEDFQENVAGLAPVAIPRHPRRCTGNGRRVLAQEGCFWSSKHPGRSTRVFGGTEELLELSTNPLSCWCSADLQPEAPRSQLRLCGRDVHRGWDNKPPPWVASRPTNSPPYPFSKLW